MISFLKILVNTFKLEQIKITTKIIVSIIMLNLFQSMKKYFLFKRFLKHIKYSGRFGVLESERTAWIPKTFPQYKYKESHNTEKIATAYCLLLWLTMRQQQQQGKGLWSRTEMAIFFPHSAWEWEISAYHFLLKHWRRRAFSRGNISISFYYGEPLDIDYLHSMPLVIR